MPHFIQEMYEQRQQNGTLPAYVMFVDLSGFTPLTQTLMNTGNTGAERLSNILNSIFEPLVRVVYARGGYIPYFAGDAFLAIFPADREVSSSRNLIDAAISMREYFYQRSFQFDGFSIGLKIGLSYGVVEWGIVGQSHKSFYFRGKPIDQSAAAQDNARDRKDAIILDQLLYQQLDHTDLVLEPLAGGFYRLDAQTKASTITIPQSKIPQLQRSIVQQFLPRSVVEYRQEGEFRTVISVFISFRGVYTHRELNRLASVVLDQINSFSGYFKEIDFGDKGGVMVGFFGAPVSFENNVERALEFIHALRKELQGLQKQSDLEYRVGITSGIAFTGNIGGKERCQYAAVGNRVNLGARLMMSADWGEVLVDEEIQKDRLFNFYHKGDIQYKGIQGLIPTFIMGERNKESRLTYSGQLIGRNQEMERLLDFSSPLKKGQSAGIVQIFGEAGIGKSRVSFELKKILTANGEINWLLAQADQILKKPFNPFIYLLRNYFEQSPDGSSSENLAKFETHYQVLLDRLERVGTEEVQPLRRELVRTKSVLAAIIGILYFDSLWEQLDAKGRYENTISAIINLLLAEAAIQPLVLEVEDGHWIDENSRELLQELTRRMKGAPLMILITARYLDDGSKPFFIAKATLQELDLPHLDIYLNNLTSQAVRLFAEKKLEGSITDEFFDILLRTSNSNPFYLQQILEYFVEQELLEKNGSGWYIRDKNIQLSNSINAILTARIDRLSTLLKETVKAAAVIGREFEVPVLSEVMQTNEAFQQQQNGAKNDLLQEQILLAERSQIWRAMNEMRYIFRHSLLREAVYGMQLRTRLQQLHRLIAEAIEKIFADKLEERYVDLAFHYEQANVFDKTVEYLRKAADYARRNYQNQQALEFYEKLLEKLNSQEDDVRQIQTHLKKGKILELIGKWDHCQEAFEYALKLAKTKRDVILLGQANNCLGRVLTLKGQYPEAHRYLQTAAQLFLSVDYRSGIAEVYGNLGELNFREGQYDEAKNYFLESIDIVRKDEQEHVDAQIIAKLGLTYMNQGYYDDGIRVQLEHLDTCQRKNDKQGMGTLYTYLGIVYLEKGDYERAMQSFEQGLDINRELGNRHLVSISIGNIGIVYERQGDYRMAMEHYEKDLKIVEELGDKQGIAIALGLIGQLLNVQGKFHQAIEYLQKDLMLCEELGYQKGIAKAVNTLGDIFFYLQQYDRSLYFYDRAIDVTRQIGNRLVLGFSLVEKGAVLQEIGNLPALKEVVNEALNLAEELGNPDLLFEAQLIAAKTNYAEKHLKEAVSILLDLLQRRLSPDQEAAVYFELAHIFPQDLKYRSLALRIYDQLYRDTPRFTYHNRIESLQELARLQDEK